MDERRVRAGTRGNLLYEVHTLLQSWPLVKWGSSGHPVPTLQYLLRAHGHRVTVDGIFGARTESAVRIFQTGRQLTVDGVVGAQTWGALVSEVSEGSSGDAVRGVQEEFQFRNLSGDPSHGLQIDGIFGPRTETAVRGFQQALHRDIPSVTVDGIVGPITWRALVSGMLSL
jgi:peptidoglycan hydrolase-like protein with peptidoglycan-binding domain